MFKLGAGAAAVAFDIQVVHVRADAASPHLICTTACVLAQLCCCRRRLRRLTRLHSPPQDANCVQMTAPQKELSVAKGDVMCALFPRSACLIASYPALDVPRPRFG